MFSYFIFLRFLCLSTRFLYFPPSQHYLFSSISLPITRLLQSSLASSMFRFRLVLTAISRCCPPTLIWLLYRMLFMLRRFHLSSNSQHDSKSIWELQVWAGVEATVEQYYDKKMPYCTSFFVSSAFVYWICTYMLLCLKQRTKYLWKSGLILLRKIFYSIFRVWLFQDLL